MNTGLYVKWPLLFSDFSEIRSLTTDFRKFSNVKSHENPSIGSRVFPCQKPDIQTDRYTWGSL